MQFLYLIFTFRLLNTNECAAERIKSKINYNYLIIIISKYLLYIIINQIFICVNDSLLNEKVSIFA